MNLASIVDPHPDDAPALISRGVVTTYGELRAQTSQLRGGMVAQGLEPGDRVVIIAANNWYFVVTYIAALGAGLVAVPLNPGSPALELQRQIEMVRPKAVVVGPSGQRNFAAVDVSDVGTTGGPIIIGCGDHAGDGVVKLDDLFIEPTPVVSRAPSDLAVLMFTSGTAGAPKAAMLTHDNLVTNIEQVLSQPERSQNASDVTLAVLPFSHIFGLNVVLGLSLAAGCSTLLIERFDPSSTAESIERHDATVVSGPPTMWQMLASLPDDNLSAFKSVRIAVSGAARLTKAVAEQVKDRLGVPLSQGYGLTETSPVLTTSTGLDLPAESIGLPVPLVEMRLVDETGADVLVGDPGEIWVKGPNVFGGYFEDPEASARVFSPDGWLMTGDIGVVDDAGHLYLVDRSKDLIIVSGFNVFPAEVEGVLGEHPGIAQAAVVGVPHPHSGEAVKAFVVPSEGRAVEEDDIIEFCAARLARYKCPAKVMFVTELPVDASGKIRRNTLRSS